MTYEEWLDKYKQLVDLANELNKCLNANNIAIQCCDCILKDKCDNITAILDYI